MFVSIINNSDQRASEKNLYDFQAKNTSFVSEKPIAEVFSNSHFLDTNHSTSSKDILEFSSQYKVTDSEILIPSAEEEHFFESRKKRNLQSKYLGQVVQSDSHYELNAGDRLQLGLTTLFILEKSDCSAFNSVIRNPKQCDYIDPKVDSTSKATCKICLESAEESSDVLISACECSGTCKYAHIKCLKSWIDTHISKANTRQDAKFFILTYKSIACEVCHEIYPWNIVYSDHEEELISFQRPNSNYILIEKIDPSNIRTVAMIRDFPQITIGRNLSANIILHDNAASRQHAVIKLVDGVFVIKDENSKFGTIVEVKKSLKLSSNLVLKYKHYLIEMRNQKEGQGKNRSYNFENSSDEEEECKKKVSKNSKKIKKFKK